LAFVTLLWVLGAAVGTLLVGGVVLHAISPTHTFDIFYALHQQFVVGTLLGLAIFWLLPPHPWVNESGDAEVREPAQAAGETGSGGASNVTALAEYRGRDSSHRRGGQGEVAG
jgi:MFS family permease